MKSATRRFVIDLSTRANGVVTAILRSPFHWLLSPGLALITVTGRKSGRRYTIPVGYHAVEDAIVILVGEPADKQWWRNYRAPGPIELTLRGRTLRGEALSLAPGSPEFRRRADASFRRSGFVARIFSVRFDPRTGLTDAQAHDLARHLAIVRVTLSSED